MSYSLQVKATTKAEARAAVEAKFDADVVKHQPNHERDRAAMLANVDAALSLLADDDTKDVAVQVNGYVAWNGSDQMTAPLTAVGITCSVGLANRE